MIGLTRLLGKRTTVSEALRSDGPSGASHDALRLSAQPRPVVVWNVTDRCNLRCEHCYLSAEHAGEGEELTLIEGRDLIRDLAGMGVPVLLFSGGEPLLRDDLEDLSRCARDVGLRPVVSTNGTLVDARRAQALKHAGVAYVGVSIDGTEATHDRFRAKQGAFRQAAAGLRHAAEAGLKTGIRFTINRENHQDLPAVLDLVEAMGVPRFCMYHLVYSGRGRALAARDLPAEERRRAVDLLIDRVLDWDRRGVETEVLTADQHADGVYVLRRIEEHDPGRSHEVRALLEAHGGCSAGCRIAAVDPRGDVHPCQFWGHLTLGNVRTTPFSRIWAGRGDECLAGLRDKARHVKGRCGRCAYKDVCGGCRVRAEAVHEDAWAEDPACYLTESEILGGDVGPT